MKCPSEDRYLKLWDEMRLVMNEEIDKERQWNDEDEGMKDGRWIGLTHWNETNQVIESTQIQSLTVHSNGVITEGLNHENL